MSAELERLGDRVAVLEDEVDALREALADIAYARGRPARNAAGWMQEKARQALAQEDTP